MHIIVGEIKHRSQLLDGFVQLALRLAAIGEASRIILEGEGAVVGASHLVGNLYLARLPKISDADLDKQKATALQSVDVSKHDCQLNCKFIIVN